NLGRNVIYGPNFSNLNLSIVKDTALPMLGESGSLQFRAEFFNILNMVSWNNPSGTVFSPITADNNTNVFLDSSCSCIAPRIGNNIPGRINSTASRPREIQFALKILF
ncbi:MAG: hypothetical protein HY651_13990, partial [Acidobacteria bacterium]|nr:hypothetical protein [Acidobacteriota bacterium]